MSIGSITTEEPLEMFTMKELSDFYYCSINEKLTKRINDLLYNFAQDSKMSLLWICDNFTVDIKLEAEDSWNSSEDTKIKHTWTYKISLIRKSND